MTEDRKYRCPVTKGQPTSMSDDRFHACCEEKKEQAKFYRDAESVKIKKYQGCLDCPDGFVPEELTIIKIDKTVGVTMASSTQNRQTGMCVYCRTEKKVAVIKGKKTCTMCENLLSNIRQRPELVAQLLVEMAPDSLPHGKEAEALKDAKRQLEFVVKEKKKTIERLNHKLEKAESSRISTDDGLQVDRVGLKDLGLRLAISLIKGDLSAVDVSDVELLRSC